MDDLDAQPSDRLARPDALERLCSAILEGKMLSEISLEWGVSKSRLLYWCAADTARSARVREARVQATVMYEEQAMALIMGARDDLELKRAKEAAHHLRWRASKINPKDYGDKIEVEQTINVSEASEGTLARELASLGMAGVAQAAVKAGGSRVH